MSRAPARPPRSEAALARLIGLHPKLIDLSLGRIERLLGALGHPERRLPPVVHVAGTNGKGSVIAFLQAIAQQAGLRAHVYTSPHLVRFNERIAVAGEIIDDDDLADILDQCEAANGGAPITFFEITTAAAFLAFARAPYLPTQRTDPIDQATDLPNRPTHRPTQPTKLTNPTSNRTDHPNPPNQKRCYPSSQLKSTP